METTTTTTTTTTSEPTTPTGGLRNTFLTVICILSFIGSGWGVISAVRSYASADTASALTGEILKNAQDKMDQQNTPDVAKQIVNSVGTEMTPDNIRKSSIFGIISNLLTLLGAILMWNLRKVGFYAYIAGIIVLIAGPIALGGILGIIGAGFSGLIGIIFIVMYGLNLKYMTK